MEILESFLFTGKQGGFKNGRIYANDDAVSGNKGTV